MVTRSVVTGWGAYLPEKIVTNDDLAKIIDTSDEWIIERTGIRQRHVAADGENTSDLGYNAALQAMERAGVSRDDIDFIVLGTATPDQTFPSTATRIQERLGANGACAFDVAAACSGFVYALTMADNFLRLGQGKKALVIGAETFSRILDWEDRTTCVLFGDGAGAVVLESEENPGTSDDRGILSTHLHSDGRQHDLLYADGGPSSTQTAGVVKMVGREVFRHAVGRLSEVVEEALECNNLSADDVDWLVPHQANKRILDSTAKKLRLPPEKMVVTVDRHANTSAASIPLALNEAASDGRIKRGDLVLMEAMGAGFTWASAALRW
ncbi:MAG: ketoacyl-ACP synthase III [Rhodospirillales bacterium]|jgi:3-oxoacyl-[acyl-carrier-protein] synthase-3|nr:ketoacyl-ACP synthase III [Rhodospirillales bacterium]MBT4007130.1 ketoacyl-ACP synthase III [Rhodospirillales bacterium]MBT5076922.1 ketoacyl-ACP synthase III [Rhodospirillales bacterium]MBT5113463.1 ketoacyl-ACP synthase III [Rhodospirillales bacterium]MBT5673761.1 ketoacyl-ACP synthase III [Rhodospirillales bacterium]